MTEQPTTSETTRKNIICTFSNHAPIRFWGDFDAAKDVKDTATCNRTEASYIDNYCDCLWDANRDFGHHDIHYYTCKSGKRIYFASYNSGEIYGNHSPKTTRTYLKDATTIQAYFAEMDQMDEWYRICGRVDPSLIVDSDLL